MLEQKQHNLSVLRLRSDDLERRWRALKSDLADAEFLIQTSVPSQRFFHRERREEVKLVLAQVEAELGEMRRQQQQLEGELNGRRLARSGLEAALRSGRAFDSEIAIKKATYEAMPDFTFLEAEYYQALAAKKKAKIRLAELDREISEME
jgi:hypothetical protein